MPISAFRFTSKGVEAEENITPSKAHDYVRKPRKVWLDVVRESNEEIDEMLSLVFPEYHDLILEDCIEDTRPKIERYKDMTFMVLKTMPSSDLKYSQMNIILGNDFILTIRSGKTDLSTVKKYLGRQKKKEVDFAIYKILEKIFEDYSKGLDKVEDTLETFEEQAIENPEAAGLADVMELKKELFQLHKLLTAQREIVAILFRGEIKHISPDTRIYLRDAYDEISRMIDLEDIYRDTTKGLIDLHLSATSAQANEVMKVLTVIATFVLVPSLIAGIYGMNFTQIPLLDWYYGPHVAMFLMVGSVLAIWYFFKKKDWI